MSDVDAETDLSVLVDINLPVPCGHSEHDIDKDGHEGYAKYLLTVTCPICSWTRARAPRCEKFIGVMFRHDTGIRCAGCGAVTVATEWAIIVEPL